jgi:uncharacterized membrane protein YcaP (DUF421 family)
MFDLTIGIGEIMFRATIVYGFLFLLLRFGGKKHVGELSPFDLLVLLILSETVQNALIADDKSLAGGLVSAATLVAISHIVGYLTWRSKKAERFFDGIPRVLIRNGKVRKQAIADERITHSELIEALRREGCTTITNVRFAVLENDGSITVGLKNDNR